jgi:hypothetical protein
MEVSNPPEYATTTFFANSFSLNDVSGLTQQTVQNRLLHVQAIFRLIVYNRAI